MKPLLKPGSEVTFMGLSEPVMTIVSINNEIDKVVCKYYDELLKKHIKLESSIGALHLVVSKNQNDTSEENDLEG